MLAHIGAIALAPSPPCEPVHMRCAPMRRTRAHCAANPISPGSRQFPIDAVVGIPGLSLFLGDLAGILDLVLGRLGRRRLVERLSLPSVVIASPVATSRRRRA